ncbi:hypothetical protein Dsin_001845 [Dipteronia sinensis]|uniref:Uncharacterized protein n=1 Tax=Dipteronia sinensis TaxID=43782 RepID=A0AAE0B655_9ROSI|nr:hypothetical protein Dsin_001845 [Dipteronia sinensis]
MTSFNNPLQIVDDDDDEFDWEAAVKEIDVACETTKPSSASNPDASTKFSSNDQKKKPSISKQSKLDKFFGNAGPRPQVALRPQVGPIPQLGSGPQFNVEFDEGNEKMCCLEIDAEAAKTWIYPVNVPVRDYQFNITKTALFANTLVALPTGLGKTLIAAVVMYNYFRWFQDGKIVFAAPSRPLVMQQIEACHNIVGIPQEWTIDMTGQISPTRRAYFWKTKRVFFVTPQVLEKDIQSGTCLVKYLVCLVIDEAHRALGNYSYCMAVRELMSVPVQLRILALTATPGSKQQTIQLIIDNLHISTLEYRNENDDDVSRYVHNRKTELMEVAMGQDAAEISNLLLDIICPYVNRLSSYGLLQNRDCQTLSPIDLLSSREKFRKAPPPDLPHIKFGEVEAYFGALITLYHIRRLLSGHGIRPAFEMLEEKLKQGSFARFMSKNEIIRKVKLLMQQSLSHGAPSPKLSKMLEVLVDHFKTKDPKHSRVIIFSNFRGSVRDIMSTLANIGNLVKATEFIGQSSGKTLKGQSQKVQQAVLEKFRAGEYNVIVATSIGEEGLDIMEVDLVICFDANVSPLRMIQRMGRTGRKHDGRVVVLACEGSELKGYMRKQASSKAINIHMRNGGMNSFNFHPSPRMVSHIIKPEVQLVELSIDRFVTHVKKVKGDQAIKTPVFNDKLTVAESEIIAKYFHSTRNSMRPSLIAFPHFQAFPSRVHKVMHSYKTGMLIDIMQHLQGLTVSRDGTISFVEDEVSSSKCLGVQTECEKDEKDSLISDDIQGFKSLKKVTYSELSPIGTLRTTEKHSVPHFYGKCPTAHSYLFCSDFVSVDALGNVLIVSLPALPFKEFSHSKCLRASNTLLLNHMKQDSFNLKTSDGNCNELTMQAKAIAEVTTSQTTCINNGALPISKLFESDEQEDKRLDDFEKILETPIVNRKQLNEGDISSETLDVVEIKELTQLADEYNDVLSDTDLSPRLTNLIKSGVVPESPINGSGLLNNDEINEFLVQDLDSLVKLCTEELTKSPNLGELKRSSTDDGATERNVSLSPVNKETQTSLLKMKRSRGRTFLSPVTEEPETSLKNFRNSSCSRDWPLSPGDKSENVEPVRKFKRLCRAVDHGKNKNPLNMNENTVVAGMKHARSFSGTSSIQNKQGRGKKRLTEDVRTFIEEEAEVSLEVEISDDEEDDQDNNSHGDSFIDDRINPTAASTQAASGGVDMMAIYRRSLLSQSPVVRQPNFSAIYTPDSAAPMMRTSESGSSSAKTLYSIQTPQTESEDQSVSKNPASVQINQERITSEAMACTTTDSTREIKMNMENWKRKLNFFQSRSVPAINLEQQFAFQSDVAGRESCQQGQADEIDTNRDTVDDDDRFYEYLDFDAMEEHAALLLKQKPEFTKQKQDLTPNFGVNDSPSFDLGV